ncbi:RHS repeat-associated core domain-containing protein [Pseudomonas fluorescens]|uniref:RHS repeat-associated core domain-containing protein n=1 Tax=Pseudomonas fluorescens TaxID=294 RepID=A0A5E7DEV4_PSEFL|nr:RHS repeat-associated core domain-containing protein [Pseudomonas fluorescens]VVO05962.1 hypothetical protein PS710_03056 [Pseudomonas fluorescens]
MQPNRDILLCRYQYNALDQLVGCTSSAQEDIQRFYLKDRLVTEIQGAIKRSIMQHDDQLLAQHRHQGGTARTTFLATDQQRSVLNAFDTTPPHAFIYTPYGHHAPGSGLLSLLGFNGERPDPATGHYLLGKGYRAFNPVLMRFNSPDSWSPFGKGGLNAYAYCHGDPLNCSDPSGHVGGWSFIKKNLSRIIGNAWSSSEKKTIKNPTTIELPSRTTRGASEPMPPLIIDTGTLDRVGTHGSTTAHRNSLTTGLHPNFMNRASGLSSGPGFYVSPTRRTSVDFSEVAASYDNGTAHVYQVYVSEFKSMIPGRHYRFGTMGEGGLTYRSLNEMEIVLRERIYRRVSIQATEIRGNQVLPRASEAPF